MILKSIVIKNFRSIRELEIPTEKIGSQFCNILLGKNETGKSNILKGISLMPEEAKFDYNVDCNKQARQKENRIVIRYILDTKKISISEDTFKSIGILEPIIPLIKLESAVLQCLINPENKKYNYLQINIKDNPNFSKYIINTEGDSLHTIEEKYSGEDAINEENIQTLLDANHSILSSELLTKLLNKKLYSHIVNLAPKTLFWAPSENFLINEIVDLNAFATNPTSKVPLRNIFHMADINDIESRINLIREDDEQRFQLEQDLSKKATSYINKKWPEHEINIMIRIDKDLTCNVNVEDKDDTLPKYKMEQRSDGFKQFVSILLSLSIESNTKKLTNHIILIDEPEVHLHPSGIKYLREELLKISESNILILSSHSIYMVDKKYLHRHFKIDKEKSVTSIRQIDKNNPYEEEVIYEALGTSIYEHIHPYMIVLEGKTDKDMFDLFTKKFKTEIKPGNIGSISADGVEKIPQYTKFIDGKFVKGYVLVDSDNDGVRIKDKVKTEHPSFNSKNTFEINDIIQTNKKSTLEDLYPIDIIIEAIREIYTLELELSEDTPVIKQLQDRNKTHEVKIDVDYLKSFLINKVITEVSRMNIDDTKNKYVKYYNFITRLHKKLS